MSNTWSLSPITAYGNVLTERNKKLILVGNSIFNSMLIGLRQLINTTYSVNWQVIDLAIPSETSTDIRNRIDAELDLYADVGAYVMVDAGGADVANTRPYSTATQQEKDTLAENLEHIFNAILDRSMIPIPTTLSFRDYDDYTMFYEDLGTKPYIDNITLPIIQSLNSPFLHPNGRPFVDTYNFLKTNIHYLSEDNIHLTSAGNAAYRQFVMDTVVKPIMEGVNPTQLPSLPVPPTPTITVATVNGTRIAITWTMPNETSIAFYQIEFKKSTDTEWTRGAVITAPTKTSTLAGLEETTTYNVRVRSAFINNAGEFSTPVTEATSTAIILFQDTFTDTTGVSILSHTADLGGTWVTQTGWSPATDANIEGNRIRPRSTNGVYRTNMVMSTADYIVEVDFVVLSLSLSVFGTMGINARASASANTFYNFRYNNSSKNWALVLFNNGVSTGIGNSFDMDLVAGQTYKAKLAVIGNTIQGYVDGVLVCQATDNTITEAGSAGVRAVSAAGATTGCHFDNFKVIEG